MSDDDIVSTRDAPWLVVGWFTPDYRELAESLAFQLKAHGAPYHLFAKPKLESGWNTSRKPIVALEAMNAYPGKTIILMDVDCHIRGDISLAANVDGDVGITVLARNMRRGRKLQHWIATECSSRVVVFKPTEGAHTFLERWSAQITRSSFNHDEHSMVWTYLSSPGVRFDYIKPQYSGREFDKMPGGVIVHDSAHNAQRRSERGTIKQFLRNFERRFLRTGRTSRDKTPLAHVQMRNRLG